MEISFPLLKHHKNTLKYGLKLGKKNNCVLKTRIFFSNKEGRQFRISFLMYKAHCSLCYNSIRIDNVCEDDPPAFQGIFSMFTCIVH